MNLREAPAYGNLTTPYWKTRSYKDLIEFYYPQILTKYPEVDRQTTPVGINKNGITC